jgi:hypothetical protein
MNQKKEAGKDKLTEEVIPEKHATGWQHRVGKISNLQKHDYLTT